MAFNATVTAAPVDQVFPAGTIPGGWRFTVDGPLPSIITVTSTVPTYTFTGLSPGSYTFTSVRLADNGITELGTVKTIQRTIADPSAVPKNIIILGATRLGNIQFVLWVPVPPSLQAQYVSPTATSAWPLATAAEVQALTNGEILEIRGTVRGGRTTEEVHAELETKLARATASLNGLIGFTLENDYFNGTDWVEA